MKLDVGAAQAVAKAVRERQDAQTARISETERQAQMYQAFVSGQGPRVFRSLGVQVPADEGKVYTIGYHNAIDEDQRLAVARPAGGSPGDGH